jgi:pyruvate ferredoxin oxidoreductase alpha subunit
VLTGAEAVAHAMRQIGPDVVPVYPITPQTPIIETFVQFVADGRCDTEIINVESEHSAMSAAVGASSAGARVMTATSSQGLALMLEICYIAASMRCPIVMPVGSRALSGPLNIHCDHSDSMMARDSGWVQIFSENAQEVYDYILMAMQLAEDALLPVMVMQDGFTITHSAEGVTLLDDEHARRFVGEYRARRPLLDVTHPTTQGPFDMPDYYFEHKRQQADAIDAVLKRFLDVEAQYAEVSGRDYSGYFETYRLDDADYALIVLGSTAGTAKAVVDQLREGRGAKVGVLKLRLFRPFPHRALAQALSHLRAVAVLDRSLSFGSWGPLYLEIAAALCGHQMPEGSEGPCLYNYIYGLGGRDTRPEQLAAVFAALEDRSLSPELRYIGVRDQ